MGFFSLLETLFFISLAITFVLIMMLVYHFKGRLVMLEDKCNTMFEIMNSMVKEMKTIKDSVASQAAMLAAGASVGAASAASIPQESPVRPPGMAFGNGLFPPELLQIFGSRPNSMFHPSRFSREDEDEYDNDVEDEEDDDDENNGFKKIVVSDTELDDEDDEDNDVKVISVDISEPTESEPLADLEEENLNDIDIDESEVDVETEIEDGRNEPSPSIEIEIGSKEIPDYKKMDVSYLRTMVITRGLATDTKKMKKQDLIRLLEQV